MDASMGSQRNLIPRPVQKEGATRCEMGETLLSYMVLSW